MADALLWGRGGGGGPPDQRRVSYKQHNRQDHTGSIVISSSIMGRGMSGLLLLTILGTALLCLLYSEETIIPDTTTRDEATVAYRRSALVEINAPACNCSSGGAHSPGSSPLQQTGPTQQEPPRLRAVVTSLYTDDYIEAVRVLGHSIKQHNTKADMVMVYIESQVGRERGGGRVRVGSRKSSIWLLTLHADTPPDG